MIVSEVRHTAYCGQIHWLTVKQGPQRFLNDLLLPLTFWPVQMLDVLKVLAGKRWYGSTLRLEGSIKSKGMQGILNTTRHGFPHEIDRTVLHRPTQLPTSLGYFLVAQKWDPGVYLLY
jgi:hypothetical protein